MPSLVALGVILMVVGATLVGLQRIRTPRLRLSNIVTADVLAELAPLFAHIGWIDAARGRLDHAIDNVIPVRNGYAPPPTHADVVRAYAVARERLADFSQVYLRKPPSGPLIRFAALSRCVDETLANVEQPRPSADDAGEHLDAREDLLRRLDFLGGALRWDRRRLPAAAPTGGELGAVVRDLKRAVNAYLDALRPLLATRRRRGPVRSRKKRSELAHVIFVAEKEVVAADGLLARGAPVEALRTLAGVRLPKVAGPTADAAFAMASRAAATGLRTDVAARETALGELAEQCGAVLDQHVDALLSAVATDAEGRRLLQRSAQRSAQTAAEQDRSADPAAEAGAADDRAGALPRR